MPHKVLKSCSSAIMLEGSPTFNVRADSQIYYLFQVISTLSRYVYCPPLHKKWSFPLRISLVNVIKSLKENFIFSAVLFHNNYLNFNTCSICNKVVPLCNGYFIFAICLSHPPSRPNHLLRLEIKTESAELFYKELF